VLQSDSAVERPLIVAPVPTGMKIGVNVFPCGKVSSHARAELVVQAACWEKARAMTRDKRFVVDAKLVPSDQSHAARADCMHSSLGIPCVWVTQGSD
jgi:hypothetical protein